MVGRINGKFGSLSSVPIHHLDRSLSSHELVALYAITDVALVTSLRDGMNLVSFEYIACQSSNSIINNSNSMTNSGSSNSISGSNNNNSSGNSNSISGSVGSNNNNNNSTSGSSAPGVLIMSEFAGAAQSLGAGSLLVNPWNVNELSQAIGEALRMSEEERRDRYATNAHHVKTYTAQVWADTFVSELNDTHIAAKIRTMHNPPPLDMTQVEPLYRSAAKRILIIGYNATLTSSPSGSQRRNRLMQFKEKNVTHTHPDAAPFIEEIASDPKTTVIIISGSECSKLEALFGHLPVWLAAENGVYIRPPSCNNNNNNNNNNSKPEWSMVMENLNMSWVESVLPVFDYFCERTPRSFVETREFSMMWNFRLADVEFGRLQARDLLQHLLTGPISSTAVEIFQGTRSVEVRPVGVTKGSTIQHILTAIVNHEIWTASTEDVEFIMCIGHFMGKDEDIFSSIEEMCETDQDAHQGLPQEKDGDGANYTAWNGVENGGNLGIKQYHQQQIHHQQQQYHNNHNSNPYHDSHDFHGHQLNGHNVQDQSLRSDSPPSKDVLFTNVKNRCFFCTVGRKRSAAKFFVPDSNAVIGVFKSLLNK